MGALTSLSPAFLKESKGNYKKIISILPSVRGWGFGAFFKVVATFSFAGGKHYQKITIPISNLDLVLKILLFQVAFLIFFSIAIFYPYLLLVGLLLQSMALFQSRELVEYLE